MIKIPEENLPRWQKILLVLSEVSKQSKKSLKYEDIVVGVFKRFPETFHLRGYKEYPDSGDLVHKPLYDMRKNGLLNANQKTFSLTNKGLQAAEKLSKMTSKGGEVHFKPNRSVSKDVDRILKSEAFLFFEENQTQKILDTDFFQYLGVSVHTSKNEFLNRMQSMKYAINQANSFYPKKISERLKKFHTFMTTNFKEIINEISNRKERSY